MTGAERIAAERQRQIDVEGWTAGHDAEYRWWELANAAWCYLTTTITTEKGVARHAPPTRWPFHPSWWKPSFDPLRNLEKAGALIAAEIDRLLAVSQKEVPPVESPTPKEEQL